MALVNISAKVVELRVDVFCAGTKFFINGHLQRARVVFEYTASNRRLATRDRNTQRFHLSQDVHDRDDFPQGGAECINSLSLEETAITD